MHIHHPQTSASSPHTKRHVPIPPFPTQPPPSCHSEHSAFTPVILNAAPSSPVIPNGSPSVIPNAASLPPVILNAAQRSEESKSVAPAAISDSRFLPSLKMTEIMTGNFKMPTHTSRARCPQAHWYSARQHNRRSPLLRVLTSELSNLRRSTLPIIKRALL